MTDTDETVPVKPPTAVVTHWIAPVPGNDPGEQGTAGIGLPGPNHKLKSPTWWQYLFVVLGSAMVTGWVMASVQYGGGKLEEHGVQTTFRVLSQITDAAVIPVIVLVLKDLGSWLLKLRQAWGLGS